MNYHDNKLDMNNELIKKFLVMFNGTFAYETPTGEMYYQDDEGEWYETPENETEYFALISQSIEQNYNLFLKNKYIHDNDMIV